MGNERENSLNLLYLYFYCFTSFTPYFYSSRGGEKGERGHNFLLNQKLESFFAVAVSPLGLFCLFGGERAGYFTLAFGAKSTWW